VETKQQTETTGNYLITGGLMNGVQAVFYKDAAPTALLAKGRQPN
jgi:hypothetical protein